MSKSKKLLLAVTTLFFAVCLSLLVAGCNNGAPEHTHSYAEEWSYNDSSHWHAATCEHTTQKSAFAKHVDADDDGKCDVCNYVMHTHTFNTSIWSHDASTHWHPADCGHDLKADEAAHIDEDGDEFCDICEELLPHVHKFSTTEWQFTESTHWRPATCGHSEKGNETAHSFTAGVCECGVKQSEVDVYNALVSLEKTEAGFVEWLGELSEEGVTSVRLTALGDIIYEKASGPETVYIADRTVKVKAEDQNKQPVAGVYVKVVYMENGKAHKIGTTDALAIGVTDENGVAEIKFTLLGGFSSSETEYKLCIAEALDIAELQGGEEEDYFAIPNRYKLKFAEDNLDKQEIIFDVQQDTVFSNALGTAFEFEYSKAWSAYHTIYLPYRRYWANQLEGTDIQVEGDEPYTFTLSGGGLYDYLYFSPQKYDYSQGGTVEKNQQIIENAQAASSGYYKISFEVENNVPAEMYFWDGCDDLGAAENTMFVAPDGTPYKGYITAISGGEADVDKHTGGNFIYINIPTTDLALKLFQLGIKSETAAKVTVTVTREAEYQFFPDHTFVKDEMLSEQGNDVYIVYEARFTGWGYTPTVFDLKDVPEGVYELSVKHEKPSISNMIYAYFGEENGSNEIQLNYYSDSEDEAYKNYIKIDENNKDKYLSIYITWGTGLSNYWIAEVSLKRCEYPTLAGDGAQVFVPTTKASQANTHDINLSAAAGSYTLKVVIFGRGLGNGSSSSYVIKAKIGGREYTLDFVPGRFSNSANATSTFTGTVEITETDKTISLQTYYTSAGDDKENQYLAKATLTLVADI